MKAGRSRALICAALALTTLVTFWPGLGGEFLTYDDDYYITNNPNVQEGLTLESFRWAWSATYYSSWHPLTWLSHLLDWELYGLEPWGHHFTSLIFHVLNALLLFGVLVRMTGSTWRSAFVAALFALHPLRVESVVWVSERKDVLSTFFWLLGIAAYARYASRPSSARYLLVFALIALGLAAKPMLVTAPFLFLLFDFWPLARVQSVSVRQLILEKLPLLGLSVASAVITYLVQRAAGAMDTLERFSFLDRVSNAAVSYIGYAWKGLWPSGLAIFYPHPGASLPVWQVLGALALLVVLTLCALVAYRRRPYLAVGWLWYLGTLVPVIGLVQVGGQALADRYSYVPLIGLFVALTWGLADLVGQAPGRVRPALRSGLAAAGVLVVAASIAVTRTQLAHWRDTTTVFERALAVTEDNYVAHLNLALALNLKGDFAQAVGHYEEAIRIQPGFTSAHNNFGNTLRALGRTGAAIEHWRIALRIDPRNSEAHFNLAIGLLEQQKTQAALRHFANTVELDPDHVEAHFNIGTLLADRRSWQRAAQHLSRVVEIQPDNAEGHYNLGAVRFAQGDHAAAWKHMRLAERHGHVLPEHTLQQLRQRMPEPPDLRE